MGPGQDEAARRRGDVRHRAALALPLAVAVAAALRLYPYTATGLPYSIDSWPLLRNTEQLLAHTPTPLSSHVFDGYNNYWPLTMLYGSLASLATGTPVIDAMGAGVPLASALTIILLYAVARRLGLPSRGAALAALLAAAGFPLAFFSSGVVKEAYAYPLYLLIVLAYLARGTRQAAIVFLLGSAALVAAHHLTTLVALTALAAMAAAELVWAALGEDLGRGVRGLCYPTALALLAGGHYYLYAYRGMRLPIFASEVLSLSSYQLVFLAAALHYTARTPREARGTVLAPAATATVLLVAVLTTRIPLMPGLPRFPPRYLVYEAHYILAAPLAALGLAELRRRGEYRPVVWLASTLGLLAYAVFSGQPLGRGLASRIMDFLWIPLAVAVATGIERRGLGIPGKALAAAAAASVAVLGAYSTLAPAVLGERYLGHFWLYTQQEFDAGRLLSQRASGPVACDSKIGALLERYMGVEVEVAAGYKYLEGEGKPPDLLLTYKDLLGKGYFGPGGTLHPPSPEWRSRLLALSQVYTNGWVSIHAG